jgi:hypothetical protein
MIQLNIQTRPPIQQDDLELKTEGLEEQGASGEPRIHDPENRPRRL